MHDQLAVAHLDRVAVAQNARDRRLRAPGAERGRDRTERAHHVLGDPVAQHQVHREAVVVGCRRRVVLDERHGLFDRRDVRSGMRRDDVDEPQVVDVLMRQQDQLDVLDRVPVLAQLPLELVECATGVGARVDQRQRLVLDQVGVDAADRERRGDGEAMDAGGDRRRERVRVRGAHERIRASTSSRFSAM